jgi:hypothetical protein
MHVIKNMFKFAYMRIRIKEELVTNFDSNIIIILFTNSETAH